MNEVSKPGYKHTELGWIPEEWEVDELGSFIKLKNGYSFKSEFFGDKGPILITPGNFKIGGGLSFNARNTTRYKGTYTNNMTFHNGDLLMVMTDLTPDCNLLGKPGIVTENELMLHNQRIGKIVILDLKKSRDFLYHFFTSTIYSKWMKETATGSTVRHTSTGTIKASKIPLPPLPEQTAIAKALSDMDSYIQSLEALITKKRLIKHGAMQELLTPKEDWEEKCIGDLVSISTGSKNTQDKIEDGAFPFFVRSHTIERINSFSYEGEAVLTAGDGVGTGKIFHYINDKFDLHQRVYIMSDFPESLDGYYFYLYFSENFYDRVMQMTAKSSVDSVRREMIANMRIPLPSIQNQKEISESLREIELEIISLEKKLSKALQIKQGMMQELLTGKIRLV